MRVLIHDLPLRPHAQAGQVLDLPEAEAKDMIARGTATAAPDEPPAAAPVAAAPVASTSAVDVDVAETSDVPASTTKTRRRRA